MCRVLIALIAIHTFALAQPNGFVGVQGKAVVTAGGVPLILKGINLGNWLVPEGYMFKFDHVSSPRRIEQVFNELLGPEEARRFWSDYRDAYITQDDIRHIRKMGLNSVRVPFNARLLALEEHPDVWLPVGFEMLDRVVRWCKSESVYVILDMHCAPGGQTGDNIDDSFGYPFLFESPEAQRLTVEIWRRIAARYKDETIVIGYDLLNEPIAHYFDADKLNPLLEPLFKTITEAIRDVDTNHIVFLGGAQWNSNFTPFGKPFDHKLVYTFHKYWTEPTQKVIQDYIDFSNKYHVPIWMGESGENRDGWIDTFRVVLEKNSIGWCFWPYKKMKATSCLVTFDQPDGYDEIIQYAKSPRTSFEELRKIRPDIMKVRKTLDRFLESSRFHKCRTNDGYAKVLGLVK